eukprot:5794448-Alexandrium_andersonii.AAC.1
MCAWAPIADTSLESESMANGISALLGDRATAEPYAQPRLNTESSVLLLATPLRHEACTPTLSTEQHPASNNRGSVLNMRWRICFRPLLFGTNLDRTINGNEPDQRR